jgi:ribosomal protein S18
MAKILIEFRKCGPEAYIRGFGRVNLIDFYPASEDAELCESPEATRSKIVTMDEEDLEMIRRFASDRSKISAKQIDEFQNELNRKYPALSIPEQAEV